MCVEAAGAVGSRTMPGLSTSIFVSTLLLSFVPSADTPSVAALAPPPQCGNCSLCLAVVDTLELLPRPVLRIIDGAMDTAAGVCKQIPGPSGKECFEITSHIGDLLEYILQGCNATGACQALGAC
jgi:hypothetical protein